MLRGRIREFVDFINKNKTALHPEAIYMAGERSDSMCEIALQYNDGYNEVIVSFANNIHTPEGGMHETGFKAALTRALNNYGKKSGILKEGDSISGEDSREGLTAVISVKLTNPQFEGQTKAKSATPRCARSSTPSCSTACRSFWRRTPPSAA